MRGAVDNFINSTIIGGSQAVRSWDKTDNNKNMNLNKTLIGKITLAACSFFLIGMATGCSSIGEMKGGTTDTAVSLNQNNYRAIKVGATGKSYGFYLLGIIPITSPTASDAKADLYRSVGESLNGRAIALANQTEDHSTLYLILFSIPRATLTADVIEFTSNTPATPAVTPPSAPAVALPVTPAK